EACLVTNVQAGAYKNTGSAGSCKAVIQYNVRVSPNEVRRSDFQLQVRQAAETVEVVGAGTALQTDKADVRAEITSQDVTELPYNGGQGRNFQSLLYLIPGAGIPATPE